VRVVTATPANAIYALPTQEAQLLQALELSKAELAQATAMQQATSGGGGGEAGAPVGLLNVSVHCHANSLLQALFALLPLRREIVLAARALPDDDDDDDDDNDNDDNNNNDDNSNADADDNAMRDDDVGVVATAERSKRASLRRSRACLRQLGALFTRMAVSRLPVSPQVLYSLVLSFVAHRCVGRSFLLHCSMVHRCKPINNMM
jgi:hypothetical protein